MECCGEVRSTPYCPQCGKKIVDTNGLPGLLLHVQQRVRSLERNPSDAKMTQKWKNWERLLTQVIESQPKAATPDELPDELSF